MARRAEILQLLIRLMGYNSTMIHLPIFLVILLFATVIATLFHALRLPTIVGLILAGLLIGPHGLGLVSSVPGIENITELGGTLLMFTLGLEFSFKRLRELRHVFLRLGLLQVVLTTLVMATIGVGILHFPIGKSIFMGFLLALSSTALVLKLLEESRELISPFGNASLAILLFQDIAFIPMVLILPWLISSSTSIDFSPILVGAKLIFIPLFLWLSSRYAVPFLFEKVALTRSRELFYFCVMSVCLGTAALIKGLGLSEALGAFMAGVMLSDSPYGKQVSIEVLPFRDVFLGLFFLAVGMLLDLNFVTTHWQTIAVLGLTSFVLKTLLTFLTFRWNHFSTPISLIGALILCQIGEFSFILANMGLKYALLDPVQHQYFLSLSILSMMATPFLFRLGPFLGLHKRITALGDGSKVAAHEDLKDHVIIIGFGLAGQKISEKLEEVSTPHHILELNYQQVKRFEKKGKPILFGDATRAEVLESVGLSKAKLVIITVHGQSITRAILSTIRRLRPKLPVVVRILYSKELEELERSPYTDYVVAEFETTERLLEFSFKRLGV